MGRIEQTAGYQSLITESKLNGGGPNTLTLKLRLGKTPELPPRSPVSKELSKYPKDVRITILKLVGPLVSPYNANGNKTALLAIYIKEMGASLLAGASCIIDLNKLEGQYIRLDDKSNIILPVPNANGHVKDQSG